MMLLQVRNDLGFGPDVARRAPRDRQGGAVAGLHGGAAGPLSMVATPGRPDFVPDIKFDYSRRRPGRLAKSGYCRRSPQDRFATTNGEFRAMTNRARDPADVEEGRHRGRDQTMEYAK